MRMTNHEDTHLGEAERLIERSIQEIESDISVIQDKIEPLKHKMALLHKKRRLLQEALKVGQPEAKPSLTTPTSQRQPPTAARRESVPERVRREVAHVLATCDGPIHIRDLIQEYKRQGFQLPGKGQPANITVHLSGWDGIISPRRGFYELRHDRSKEKEDEL